jgi:hypothetical protein
MSLPAGRAKQKRRFETESNVDFAPINFFYFFVGLYSVDSASPRRRKSLVAPGFESGSEAIFTEYCPRESDSILLGGALLKGWGPEVRGQVSAHGNPS